MNQTKHDVFISYSRKDYVDENQNVIPGNEVSKIKDALTKAGITYWFDEEGIYSGQNFVEKIVTNIENAKIFLFLSTANANKSPWTCKEIASADEFKKHIIPVRIDSSPYNKKVMFRIADLDYIEYFTNPEKGMEDLIKSIKAHLEELITAERHRQEEEIREKELKREKEAQLVAEIKLTNTTLNNEESKLQIERELLLKKVDSLTDEEQKEDLKELIIKSGPVHLKYQKEYEGLIENLRAKCSGYEHLNQECTRELDKQKNKIQEQEAELDTLKTKIVQLESIRTNMDENIYVPTENDLKKWNWGAFFLTWIWGIRNRLNWWFIVLLFALMWSPLINIFPSIILGYSGTRYAWEKGQWKNWEHFQMVQREWKLFGFISLLICGGVISLYIMLKY